jgi:hypothetical protein
VSRDPLYKISFTSIPEYSNIKMATRLINLDFSRLKVTALANNNKMLPIISILDALGTRTLSFIFIIFSFQTKHNKYIYLFICFAKNPPRRRPPEIIVRFLVFFLIKINTFLILYFTLLFSSPAPIGVCIIFAHDLPPRIRVHVMYYVYSDTGGNL